MTHLRRHNPWLRGIIALYILSTLFLAAAHQHRDGLQGHDCALCTVAHTPATAVAAIEPQATPALTGYLLPLPGDQGWDFELHGTPRSRAPPLV